MIEVIKLDIFKDYHADAICVTTNSVVKKNGELVMGKGVAKTFAKLMPQLPLYFGELIEHYGNIPFMYNYAKYKYEGVPYHKAVISFPTKEHFANRSILPLILNSMEKLNVIVDNYLLKRVLLPLPGVDNGGLNRGKVLEALSDVYIHPNIILVEKP